MQPTPEQIAAWAAVDFPEQAWLSVMPPIPLADYQGPVRNPAHPEWRAVAVGHDIAPSTTRVIGMHPAWPEREVVNGWLADSILVPDLDRHEGFGKALRWYGPHLPGAAEAERWRHWLSRWGLDQTTDADRFAVAHALAEMYR